MMMVKEKLMLMELLMLIGKETVAPMSRLMLLLVSMVMLASKKLLVSIPLNKSEITLVSELTMMLILKAMLIQEEMLFYVKQNVDNVGLKGNADEYFEGKDDVKESVDDDDVNDISDGDVDVDLEGSIRVAFERDADVVVEGNFVIAEQIADTSSLTEPEIDILYDISDDSYEISDEEVNSLDLISEINEIVPCKSKEFLTTFKKLEHESPYFNGEIFFENSRWCIISTLTLSSLPIDFKGYNSYLESIFPSSLDPIL